MSITYSITCQDCSTYSDIEADNVKDVWVGQSSGHLFRLYRDENTLKELEQFLSCHLGHNLKFTIDK